MGASIWTAGVVQSEEPRKLTLQISKEPGYDFDIYRLANLRFALINEDTDDVFRSTKIEFKDERGSCHVKVPPGTYRLAIPKMANWSPGKVQIVASDPERVSVNIRMMRGGSVRIIKRKSP